jgi:hypothetical protein
MNSKPSDKEQEYFLRQEAHRLNKLREDRRRQHAEEERRRLAELHKMHCPKCGQSMTVTVLEGVEVEVCPDCRGIFLDDGELEKLLEVHTHGPFHAALSGLRRMLR